MKARPLAQPFIPHSNGSAALNVEAFAKKVTEHMTKEVEPVIMHLEKLKNTTIDDTRYKGGPF